MKEAIEYPIFGGAESFEEAHAKVVEMWGHVEPIDITAQGDATNYASRVRVSATLEPPTIVRETTTFEKVGDGHVADRERVSVFMQGSEPVITRTEEKQDRTLAPNGKPMGLWRSPEYPDYITGRERRVAFHGLMTAIENLS
jgi:hypothetical protein